MKFNNKSQRNQFRWSWLTLPSLCVAVSTLSAATDTNSPAPASPDPGTNAPAAAPADNSTNAPVTAATTNAPAAASPDEGKKDAEKADEKGEAKDEKKEAEKPEALTPEQMYEGGTKAFTRWIEFSTGGAIVSGSRPQFQRNHQAPPVFGGIEDFHYQGEVKKGTTLTVDGRAMAESDYKLKLDLQKEKLGYLKFSIDQYRTWYNGDGGFFPPTGTYYPLSPDALAIDRGEVSIEGGLTLENKPKIVVKYTHSWREGDKDSTSWGQAHPGGVTPARGLAPSTYDINEHTDTVQLDVTGQIKKVDVGGGVRYETGAFDDARKINEFPGEQVQRKITDREGTDFNMFSAHSFAETWLKKNLLVSAGLMYSRVEDDWTGSRIYGSDFDPSYNPLATDNLGFLGFNGASHMDEYVMNLNLFYKPTPHFAIIPSIRVQKEVYDVNGSGLGTLGDLQPEQFSVNSDQNMLDVRERLDLRYNGITNWVFWARGDVTEGTGNLKENGGIGAIGGIGTPPIQRETDDSRFFQKYSIGARWYPTRKLALDVGGYYKRNNYDYNHLIDSTDNSTNSFNRYPAFLRMQNFDTYDGNARVTYRPLPNVTLVSRYEYQWSTVNTHPDNLPEVESATMTTHIVGQDVSWSPWSRLYLQAGVNYVLSDTRTPASESENAELAAALLKSQNNYWTANFSTGLVLDKKTDLNCSYVYYRADNYVNNALAGVPYGSGAEEHGVTATLVRRLTENIRLKLRYGFYHYTDTLYGGNRDYNAHVVTSSIQYRF